MFLLRKYYVLNAMYCILGAPTSRFRGGATTWRRPWVYTVPG